MGGIFLSALDVTAVGPAMPRIVGSLGGGEFYAFAFSVYAVLSTTTTPVFGRLADRIGRKPVMLSGIGIFLLGSVLCAVSPSMPVFIAARGVQGLGAGALLPVAFTIVGDLYDLKERARIQGYLSGVWGVASVVGPLVGGTLVETVGWQFIFYLNVPVGLLAAALIHRHLIEEGYPRDGQNLDLIGGTFFSGAVLLLLAGMKLDDPYRVPVFVAAAMSAALFIYRERVAAHPLFDLTLFRIPVYRSANAAGFFAGAVLLGLTAFLPVYVMNVRGGSALDSGLMLTPMSFGWVLAATVGGRLLLKHDFRKIAFPGLFLLAVTSLGISRIGMETPWAVIVVLMFGTGIGFGLSFTTFLVAVQEEVIGTSGAGHRRGAVFPPDWRRLGRGGAGAGFRGRAVRPRAAGGAPRGRRQRGRKGDAHGRLWQRIHAGGGLRRRRVAVRRPLPGEKDDPPGMLRSGEIQNCPNPDKCQT